MTFGSPIFRKLLLASVLLVVGTVLTLDFLLTRTESRNEIARARTRLVGQARILEGELAATAARNLASWTAGAARRAQARITIIDPAGRVLADSEHDPATMENHGGRPEIREALAGRSGMAIRRSATIDRDLLYLTLPGRYGNDSAIVLRLSVPLQELKAAIAEVRWNVLRTSLLAVLVALVAAYFFSRSFTRRVRRLQEFADGLVNARFSGDLAPDADDELGSLAQSLNNMAAQLRDMIERLGLESARRETILSGMVEGVLVVDNTLRVTFCNQAFARAVGAQWPVPERLPVLELVRDPEFLDMLSAAIVHGAQESRRMRLSAADGHSFEIQAAPLDMRSRRGAIAVLHDITDLERLERVRKDFVANVSHEMRTPLTAIQGYAETLLSGALDDKENSHRFVEIIRAHAIRLNNIAADLLVLSDLESGQPVPAPEPVAVEEAIRAAVHGVGPDAQLRNITIHTPGVADGWISGHRLRLEQALVNLLDNAIKFNQPGGEIWVRTSLSGDGELRIEIEDNGIGIPSDDLPRVFERFYRVDKARSREVGGTGLGLSIVKHIVERMNGKVFAESRLGKGSKFILVFPTL